MHHTQVRRLFAGSAVAVAVVLAGTPPALAAADPIIDISLPAATTVAQGVQTQLDPMLHADRQTTLADAVLTYELSGDLPGVSLADPGSGNCHGLVAVRLVCAAPTEIELGPDGSAGHLPALLTAAADAVAGSTGTVRATLTADGVEPVSTTSAVEVIESVDLVAGESSRLRVAPGKAFDADLEVTDTSAVAARGVAVVGEFDYAFQVVKRYSNCLYSERRVSCLFQQRLRPGTTYGAALPFRLRKDTAAPDDSYGYFQWMTADDYAKLTDKPGTPGTGGKLRLEQVAAPAAARADQTDPDPDDNQQSVTVRSTGNQGVDIVALGAEVSGAAGAEVTATVGVRNNGPATLDRTRSGEPATAAIVTVPDGTTVTTVPTGCSLAEDSIRMRYLCVTGSLHRRGETVSWEFGLRIDEVIPNATGVIEANPPCGCGFFTGDIDKSNDKALLVINPV